MSESRETKTQIRAWAAGELTVAAQGNLEGENAKRLYALTETLTACIVTYCEPGDIRTDALDQLISAYGLASKVVDPEPRSTR